MAIRVWVLEQRVDYECGDPAGVFSSLELAKAAADRANRYYRRLEVDHPPVIAPLVWPELDDDAGFYEAESYCASIDSFRITPFDVDQVLEADGRPRAVVQVSFALAAQLLGLVESLVDDPTRSESNRAALRAGHSQLSDAFQLANEET